MPPRTSLRYLLTHFPRQHLSLCRLSMQKAEIFIVVVVYGKGTKPERAPFIRGFFCDLMIAMLSIRRGGEGCGGGDDDDGTLILSFLFADRSVRLIS